MTVFSKAFRYDFNGFFVIVNATSKPQIFAMKLPPQANKNKTLDSVDVMSKMQVLLSEKDGVIKEKDDIIDKKSDVIAQQQQQQQQQHRIEILEEYLRLANSKRFGPSSEQTPEQGHLFNEAEISSEPEQEELALPETDVVKAKTGRKPFAKNIPRHQVFAYLSDEDKIGAINTFFDKVREELDIIPAKVQILEYMQEKAVFKDEQGDTHIKLAEVVKHFYNGHR